MGDEPFGDPRLHGKQWNLGAAPEDRVEHIKHTTDESWSRIWSPPLSPATYGGRWIDRGKTGDILPDRQGLSYSDTAEKERLLAHMQGVITKDLTTYNWQLNPISPDATVSDHVYRGEYATGGNEEFSYKLMRGKGGGYVNVEAWLHEQTPEDPGVITDPKGDN